MQHSGRLNVFLRLCLIGHTEFWITMQEGLLSVSTVSYQSILHFRDSLRGCEPQQCSRKTLWTFQSSIACVLAAACAPWRAGLGKIGIQDSRKVWEIVNEGSARAPWWPSLPAGAFWVELYWRGKHYIQALSGGEQLSGRSVASPKLHWGLHSLTRNA